jgi:SAM-dependent methyltransferase
MAEHRSKHKAIDDTFSERVDEHLYSKSDEKGMVGRFLNARYSGRKIKHLLDVGAGPGELTEHIAGLAGKLTIIEMVREYREKLHSRFPQASIILDSIDNVTLKSEYDLILFSQVLYYFPECEWKPLIEKLYNALIPGGELVVVMVADSGDWWTIVSSYWGSLREYIRFDYIPLSSFKKKISDIAEIESHPFTCHIVYKTADELVEAIGREVLQICDDDILAKSRHDFTCLAERFKQQNGSYTLHMDCEALILKK